MRIVACVTERKVIDRILDHSRRTAAARRLLEPIGHLPPAEHEEAYYRRQRTPAELAALT